MQRLLRDVDQSVALEVDRGGAEVSDDPPSSAWSYPTAPADEVAGFDDHLVLLAEDDPPFEWGAARLGIP